MAFTKNEIIIAVRTEGATKTKADLAALEKQMPGLTKAQIINSKGIGKLTQTTEQWTKKGKSWQLQNVKIVSGLRQFRMEMLGVMFFGMGMTRFFGDMTKGAMDWLGIGELFQTSLNLIALEGLMPMSDGIYASIEALLELPQATKQSIGELMVWGQVGGLVLQTVGAMILGLSSLAMAFPAAAGPAAIALSALLLKIEPLLNVLPGMEGIGPAIKGAAIAVAAAGALKTGEQIIKYGKIIFGEGEVTKDVWNDTEVGMKSNFGAAYRGLIGGALLIGGAISFSQASVTPSVLDDVLAGAQTIFGASFLATSFGMKGKQAALFGIGATLIIASASGTPGLFSDTEMSLGIAGILWSRGLGKWILPIEISFFVGREIGKYVGGATYENVGRGFMGWASNTPGIKEIVSLFSILGGGPSLQYGGIVPGKMNEPIPIIAHGGERFMGIHGGNESSTVVFSPNITLNGGNISAADLSKVKQILIEDLRREVSGLRVRI